MLKFPADEVVTLELVHRPPDGPVVIGSGFSHLAVQVDDLSGMIEAVTKAGLSASHVERPGGLDGPQTSWLRDPDGYRIELCSGHQVTPMGSPLPTLARRPVPSARHVGASRSRSTAATWTSVAVMFTDPFCAASPVMRNYYTVTADDRSAPRICDPATALVRPTKPTPPTWSRHPKPLGPAEPP